ncbi:MAG: ABC transporter substrate-binding protein [Parvibaculaceae bacterium]
MQRLANDISIHEVDRGPWPGIGILGLLAAGWLAFFGPVAVAAEMGTIENGTITVAATASFPPIVSVDADGTYAGIDADIITAIAKSLGAEVKWVNIKFDGIIPGISARRFDVGMTGITDTVERQKAVDFVNYANVGSGLIVQAGNPKKISTLDDICGLTVASQTGDLATTYAKRQSDKCVAEGRAKVTVNEFPEATQSLLQLQGGRADVVIHDYPLSAYKVQKSEGQLEIAGQQFNNAPYGMAITKNNIALRDSLMKGLDAIIASGEYAKILEKYGVAEIGIAKATYNAAAE